MNLILLFQNEIKDNLVELTSEDPRAKHIIHHLRKREGDTVRIGIIDGCLGHAHVGELTEQSIYLRIHQPSLHLPMARPQLELILALPYPRTMKALWAVLTSLGVTKITVVTSALSDPDFKKSSVISPSIYEPLILEGLTQAGVYTTRPSVHIATFKSLTQLISTYNTFQDESCIKLLFDLGKDLPSVRQVLRSDKYHGAICAIGPERGWTDDEAEAFITAGFYSISLGQPVLRTDVACIAALTLVSDALSNNNTPEVDDKCYDD